jgi:hypothetical protein
MFTVCDTLCNALCDTHGQISAKVVCVRCADDIEKEALKHIDELSMALKGVPDVLRRMSDECEQKRKKIEELEGRLDMNRNSYP